jgi:uncharacterized protein (DUF1697 family)
MASGTRTHVAFIRGINVGGRSTVPMADLRSALTERGFGNVRTYIQSGNVVYEGPAGSSASPKALTAEAAQVAAAIERLRGFAPVVIVLDAADLARHLRASPYASADPAKAFLVFVDGDVEGIGDLDAVATNGEEWQAIDGVVHLHCPNGIGRSKLGERMAGSKRVPTTTRNLRTIAKVLELAGR